MDEESLNKFLKKFSDDCHTEQEHQQFIDWLNTAPINEVQRVLDKYQHILDMRTKEESGQYAQLIDRIEAKLDELSSQETQNTTYTKDPVRLWTRLRSTASVAAVLFAVTAFGIYFWMSQKNSNKGLPATTVMGLTKNELSPGGNKAVLILSDGSQIILDDAKEGVLANQGSIKIRKTAGGKVIYDALQPAGSSSKVTYNTITTPRGGQYQISLPDGSKVWLNAASSLRFPTSFSGTARNVELTGEAYFEVAKNKAMPFKVKSENQTVEVLGTHFNINAYPDEPATRTTLLEGSVKISQLNEDGNSKLLKPGQQATVGVGIRVSEVDVQQAIAWKNGYFIFSHENIESIMRQISRWYNADIKYEGNITREVFTGSVSRFENVSQVLDMLQLTNAVHFKIEADAGKNNQKERRIVVMP